MMTEGLTGSATTSPPGGGHEATSLGGVAAIHANRAARRQMRAELRDKLRQGRAGLRRGAPAAAAAPANTHGELPPPLPGPHEVAASSVAAPPPPLDTAPTGNGEAESTVFGQLMTEDAGDPAEAEPGLPRIAVAEEGEASLAPDRPSDAPTLSSPMAHSVQAHSAQQDEQEVAASEAPVPAEAEPAPPVMAEPANPPEPANPMDSEAGLAILDREASPAALTQVASLEAEADGLPGTQGDPSTGEPVHAELPMTENAPLDADPVPEARMGGPAPPPPLPLPGMGPGMVVRLRHLGIETTAQMAQADPEALRRALGPISRLVNVEGWIAAARDVA